MPRYAEENAEQTDLVGASQYEVLLSVSYDDQVAEVRCGEFYKLYPRLDC